MIEIKEMRDISIIKPIWEVLNRYNQAHSRHFQRDFVERDFEHCMCSIQACDVYRLEVVFLDNTPLGFCMGTVHKSQGEINGLYIYDDLRGKGLGSYLFNRMVLWLQTEEAENIHLEVISGNEEVISFYQKQGFKTEKYTVKMIESED